MCWYLLNIAADHKAPVLPESLDFTLRNHCVKRSATFLGFVRAFLAVISFGTCVAFAANANGVLYNPFLTSTAAEGGFSVKGILICLAIINIIHFIGACTLIHVAQSERLTAHRNVRNWMIADCVITGVFLVGVIIFLCIIPPFVIYRILAIKLIFLSMLFLWRNWTTYNLSLGPSFVTIHVPVSTPVVTQPYIINVQRV